MKNLAELKVGEKGIIKSFLDEVMSLKLLEMGILPETEVQVRYAAPLGDPICIEIVGAKLSLRLAEASKIVVQGQ
ncbi:MAG: ferrous iron transport protein A [Microscillaceae bacterium]|nr:ferrous iron transport protein A [Microscillaceae bacterium]MDW8461905.1 FeoA family protein [Cytophagales bacterium]